MPLTLWIIALVLIVTVPVFEDAARFAISDHFGDLVTDFGFYVVLVFLLLVGAFVLRSFHHRPTGWFLSRRILWPFLALACWWLVFRTRD